ncbi:MAG: pyruvate kinase [Actinomycetota bacterium]
MRRTKIVATLGPASWDGAVVHDLVAAGVDVFRLNLAHADTDTHKASAETARREADRLGRVVGLLADLPGPKMRTGPVVGDAVSLEPGEPFVLDQRSGEGDWTGVSTTVENLHEMVHPGEEIFLADGAIILRVTEVTGGSVHTEVIRRGLLRSRKGMHIPNAEDKIDAFTEDDRRSLEAALSLKVDLIGLSFIRDAEDIERVRAAMPKQKGGPLLVAKIETRSAIQNLSEIVHAADAVMVARGDLGIQMPLEEVPLLQKEIIQMCNGTGTPVITATQMLESMTHGPLPSRAEVNDVANAVLDGTDALMLSEETAIGKYPIATVETMATIAQRAERQGRMRPANVSYEEADDPVSWAIARSAVHAAEELDVAAILCPTRSGATARRVAAFRPRMPILGLGHREATVRPLALVWGVVPKTVPFVAEEEIASVGISRAVEAAREAGLAHAGQLVAVVAAGPEPRAGSTDFVRIVSA